jgi:tetratricopeptide (TPR) repeat protein
MKIKLLKSAVLGSFGKVVLAGSLFVAPLVSVQLAESVVPGQSLFTGTQVLAQVKAGNKTFEARRLPGVSQSFAKDLTEVANFLQPPEESTEKPNPNKALEVLNRISRGIDKLNPYEVAQLHQYYAFAHYGKEDYTRALQSLEKVIAQSPNIPVSMEAATYLTLAQLYGQEENYKKSLELMLKWTDFVSEIRPDQHYLFGTLYYQLEDMNNALANVSEAVRVTEAAGKIPPESWYNFQRGIYLEREDYASALTVLHKLARHYPNANHWTQMAQIYAMLNRDKEKLAALEAAYLMGGVTTERQLVVLASYFLEADAPYKAAKVLDKAINKDKSVEPTAKNLELLANAWRAAQEYSKSLAEMEKAAQKSENGNLLHTLASLYNSNDRYKDAIRVAKQALNKGGLNRPDQVHMVIGAAYIELGEFDEAIKAFKEAAKDKRSERLGNQWATYAQRERDRIAALMK